jgi:hypothetical protein
MKDTPRLIAKASGLKKYQGQPCKHGHIGIRLVKNNECAHCKSISNSIRYRNKKGPSNTKRGRPRKYPELEGPAIPKRICFMPETIEDRWIIRNKRGNKRKLRSELSIEYYKSLIVDTCPLLGVRLTYENFKGNAPSNYATLDRIDPNKGYVEGNVQIVSFRANTLKSNATLEELKMIVKNWREA